MKRWTVSCALIAIALTATAGDESDRNSVSFSRKLEMTAEPPPLNCVASVSLDYFQKGATAEVEMVIENTACEAASGTFVIEATVRVDGKQEAQKLKFPESWQRVDSAPLTFARSYPIGDNADLLRVRIRNLKCACSDDAAPADNRP